MPREYTILVRAVSKIIDAAAAYGVEPEELYRAVGLEQAILADPDNRIPFAQLVALYERAADLTGDDAFGLHVGERVDPKLFDVLGYMVVNSPTLGESLNRLVRYHSIWSDGAFFTLNTRDSHTSLTYEYFDEQIDESRQDCEMTLSIAVSFGRRVTGIEWTPREVSFRHSRPKSITEHQRIFRAPIRFNSPSNELIFDTSLLALPMATADPGLSTILERHAQELLARSPHQGGLIEQVRHLLGESLSGGDPRLERISQKLGISVRTLQRRLREEGTSHQDLLDEVRSDLSRRYLQESRLAICEVAYLLGFSEPSAFHRAFRRWTGITPKEFRRTQAPESSS
jgi:AraC-like DNA-binding protein